MSENICSSWRASKPCTHLFVDFILISTVRSHLVSFFSFSRSFLLIILLLLPQSEITRYNHDNLKWLVRNATSTGLITFTSVASDLLNDALLLDNELSTWATTARHGQWPRWQQRPVGYTFPYKMVNFHSVYLKLGHFDSAEFFIWYSENCLSHCHEISKWYDKPVVCYCWVKICIFAMSKQGPSDYFHLHARAPPMAVPGCVDERMRSAWIPLMAKTINYITLVVTHRIAVPLVDQFLPHPALRQISYGTRLPLRKCCKNIPVLVWTPDLIPFYHI